MGAIDEQDSPTDGTAARRKDNATACGDEDPQGESEQGQILNIPESNASYQPEDFHNWRGKAESIIGTRQRGAEVSARFPAKKP